MSNRSIGLTDEIHAYLLGTLPPEPDVLRRLRERTAELPEHRMQIAPEQGAFMAWLVRLIGARAYLEIGTFTGYSSTAVGLALPPDGRAVCCDVSREWTDIAREAWAEAGVADRIELRIGPAVESLDAMLSEGAAGTFDLAFIDADKANYDAYYERCVGLVRTGGVIAIDNVLWSGRVADPADDDADTRAIRSVNERVAGDDRVEAVMLPLADGLTLARIR